MGFDWAAHEALIAANGLTIDRPRRSRHPRFPEIVYPIDYGYINHTVGEDGDEIDVFVGTAASGLVGMMRTLDHRKGDTELKLLYHCSPAEIYLVNGFINFAPALMEGTLTLRRPMAELWDAPGAIAIVPYREAWPEEFRRFGQAIRRAVGDTALAIHHIGSTSVPGLAAKDNLDLQITVANLEGAQERLASALGPLGFVARPYHEDHCPPGMTLTPDQLEKRYFKHLEPPVNLHVRAEGRFNQRYALLFRDYLRAVPMAANAYGEIKRQLARYFPENVDAYYDIKDPVCDALIAGALEWAATHDWTPAPSDA